MSAASSANLDRLRRIIPTVELTDPKEIAKLEESHKGKFYKILLPDLLHERTGGDNIGQYAYPNVEVEILSGREFGVSSNKSMWIKFIYSDAPGTSSLIAPHTPVRVKKYVYDPVARSDRLVVQRYTAKSFRDTLLNISDKHKETMRSLKQILRTRRV